MKCDSCNNPSASRLSYSKGKESCEKCGNLGAFKFSDVFFKGEYFDANITNPVTHPHGTLIKTREHKAVLLKENGLKEVGDKRHGSRSHF